MPKALVAIPVHNEQSHLAQVLQEAGKYCSSLLVVDDGSTDATPDILARTRGIRVLRHARNQGYGAALLSAFRYAVDQGFDVLVTMDSDEQHEPKLIPEFVAAAAEALGRILPPGW